MTPLQFRPASDPRATRERIAAALYERDKREERARQSDLGEVGRQGGLVHFVRCFWHILEPKTELIEGWVINAICLHLEAVTRGEINRLMINVFPGAMKSLLVNVMWPAWEWSAAGLPSTRYVTFSYGAHLTIRDNSKFRDMISHADFKEYWGHVFELKKAGEIKPENDKTGWKFASSVGGIGTGERGNRLLADDLHNVKTAESETVRTETVRWVREGMANRLNDMAKDAIIGIGQRVHEEDASAAMLEDGDYVSLRIPMEYDSSWPCETRIDWKDPRVHDGELAWPERFPKEVVDKLKSTLGPYAYCTPAESPVLMGDLSLKPIGTVNVGDDVIGFTLDTKPLVPEAKCSKRRLVAAKVLSISKSVQRVVKLTLDSGKVIRCTPDHNWYTGRTEVGRPTYMPAAIGRSLMRVCNPDLSVLSAEESRDAGWLSGFFDGEGSAVLSKKHAHYQPSCLISFCQGADRNGPLCDKLERTLTRFGFNFGYVERPCQGGHTTRWYYLQKGPYALPLHQKFLHIVQPTKWRDRIADGALGTKFIIGEEKVVSIEDDGEEEVFGLETTTGNYVVWGIASSNSAQYQQAPSPRGGGIIKREWWEVWEESSFPVCEYKWASVDSAYTTQEGNDPSGYGCWGLFNYRGKQSVILMDAWRKRLELHTPARWKDDRPKSERFKRVLGWQRASQNFYAANVNEGCSEPLCSPDVEPWRSYIEFGENNADRWPNECTPVYNMRTQEKWGLCEWLAHSGRRFKINTLIIESKASGLSVAQEIRRLHASEGWQVQTVTPEGDKGARLMSVQGMFSSGLVYAPDRDWAQMVIDEVSSFPRGKFRDLTDSTSQALKHVRDLGLLLRPEERRFEELEMAKYRPPTKALYPV